MRIIFLFQLSFLLLGCSSQYIKHEYPEDYDIELRKSQGPYQRIKIVTATEKSRPTLTLTERNRLFMAALEVVSRDHNMDNFDCSDMYVAFDAKDSDVSFELKILDTKDHDKIVYNELEAAREKCVENKSPRIGPCSSIFIMTTVSKSGEKDRVSKIKSDIVDLFQDNKKDFSKLQLCPNKL